MIYLDYNGTTPLDPQVAAAISGALNIYGNPSTSNTLGVEAKRVVEMARKNIQQMLKYVNHH